MVTDLLALAANPDNSKTMLIIQTAQHSSGHELHWSALTNAKICDFVQRTKNYHRSVQPDAETYG